MHRYCWFPPTQESRVEYYILKEIHPITGEVGTSLITTKTCVTVNPNIFKFDRWEIQITAVSQTESTLSNVSDVYNSVPEPSVSFAIVVSLIFLYILKRVKK